MVKTYQNKWVVSTKRVVIEGEERLEGVLREGTGKGGGVICHPHPLYGGSMWNNVVDAVEMGFFRAGFTTLKFNFRGVGGSTGRYDEGAGETRDVGGRLPFSQRACGRRDEARPCRLLLRRLGLREGRQSLGFSTPSTGGATTRFA